jgi:Mg2+ and Co2+ transporter CorA
MTSPPAGLEDPAAAQYQEASAAASICQDTPTRAEARTRLYRDGRLELEGFPVADISEYLPDESVTIWLDLLDPDHDDLTVLSEEFGLHPLAVEAALRTGCSATCRRACRSSGAASSCARAWCCSAGSCSP